MASRTEGIALLSMYNDEEEEDDVIEEKQQQTPPAHEAVASEYPDSTWAAAPEDASEVVDLAASPGPAPASVPSASPAIVESDFNTRPIRSPTPLRPSPSPTRQTSLSQTLLPPPPATRPAPLASATYVSDLPGPTRGKAGALGIVDYGHDEMAMSPEAEEEMVNTDFDMKEDEFLDIDGSGEEYTSTPNQQRSPLPEMLDASMSGTNVAGDSAAMDLDTSNVEIEVDVTTELKVDPLSKFLPPPPTDNCPKELQEKINKFLALKRAGKSFNSELRSLKAYRNPDFLQHAVTYQEIHQTGTCFSKDVFNAEGYDRSDYYDAIESDMKRELERKEQERKRSPKVDFISGGIQPAIGAPGVKGSSQVPGLAISTTTGIGQQLASTSTDITAKESRQNKKSKWDKVDTDLKNPLQLGGSDTASAATILTATNSGGGYTAFAQQKRREAEDKRSSDRKHERRS